MLRVSRLCIVLIACAVAGWSTDARADSVITFDLPPGPPPFLAISDPGAIRPQSSFGLGSFPGDMVLYLEAGDGVTVFYNFPPFTTGLPIVADLFFPTPLDPNLPTGLAVNGIPVGPWNLAGEGESGFQTFFIDGVVGPGGTGFLDFAFAAGGRNPYVLVDNIRPVPEPGTIVLVGALAAAAIRRRRNARAGSGRTRES